MDNPVDNFYTSRRSLDGLRSIRSINTTLWISGRFDILCLIYHIVRPVDKLWISCG